MRIVVIGAGAMGSLFGGMLKEGGEEVYLIDVWQDHIEKIKREGLFISGITGERKVEIEASTSPEGLGMMDLVILFVKSYHTKTALEGLGELVGDNTMILTLQNGLGNVELIKTIFPNSQVVAGVTSYGATMVGPGHVYHAGEGDTHIGDVDHPKSKRVASLAKRFMDCGLVFKQAENIQGLLWSKLLINVGLNGLTAITRLKNGKMPEYPGTRSFLVQLVEEGWRVAEALGIDLLYEDPVAQTLLVCEKTGLNKSSMLQDVLRERETEIDFINGAIVKRGEELGIETPYNKALTWLLKTVESSYHERVTGL